MTEHPGVTEHRTRVFINRSAGWIEYNLVLSPTRYEAAPIGMQCHEVICRGTVLGLVHQVPFGKMGSTRRWRIICDGRDMTPTPVPNNRDTAIALLCRVAWQTGVYDYRDPEVLDE